MCCVDIALIALGVLVQLLCLLCARCCLVDGLCALDVCGLCDFVGFDEFVGGCDVCLFVLMFVFAGLARFGFLAD